MQHREGCPVVALSRGQGRVELNMAVTACECHPVPGTLSEALTWWRVAKQEADASTSNVEDARKTLAARINRGRRLHRLTRHLDTEMRRLARQGART